MAITTDVPKINILLVEDDPICLSVLALVLRKMNNHVVAVNNAIEALDLLRTNPKSFDLVLTDVHMPQMSGLELLNYVQQEFKLPVVLMSADEDKGFILKALGLGAVSYLVKPVSTYNLSKLWQFVVPPTQSFTNNPLPPSLKMSTNEPIYNSFLQRKNLHNKMLYVNNYGNKKNNNVITDYLTLNNTGYNGENTENTQSVFNSSELKRPYEGAMGIKNNGASTSKKPKVVWTTTLHNRFLEAFYKLGLDNAVPRKILELMKVPGLRRENIASHLQKYRQFLKRMQEAMIKMLKGIPPNLNERPFRSSFVLNEITYCSSNLNNQFYEFLIAHSQGDFLKGAKTYEEMIMRTLWNNLLGGVHNPIMNTQQVKPSNEAYSAVKNTAIYHHSSTYLEGFTAGFRDAGLSDNPRAASNQPPINNNYVGLRLSCDGELVGPYINNGDEINSAKGMQGGDNNSCITAEKCDYVAQKINNHEMNHANNNNNNANVVADDLFDVNNTKQFVDQFFVGIEDDMNAFLPVTVENNHSSNQKDQNSIEISQQEMPEFHGIIGDEVSQLGINLENNQPLQQDSYNFDFDFGSFNDDIVGNMFDALDDQVITSDDNISFECFFAQEHGQGFNQKDDNVYPAKPN